LFGLSVNAQNLTLAVKLNISGSSTNVGSSFTFGGTVIDDNGILNAADVLVGDSIFYLEEGIIYPLVITTKNSASGASLNITCLAGTPSVTTAPSGSISGQVAISRKTFTGYCSVPSGLNATLAAAMENRFKQQVDLAIVNAQEIAFTSGTGVPNSTVATSLGYRLAKNNGGDGDLYEWNGTTWILNNRSGGGTLSDGDYGDIDVKSGGTVMNIDTLGATNGQVLTWNGNNWLPGTVSGGVQESYKYVIEPVYSPSARSDMNSMVKLSDGSLYIAYSIAPSGTSDFAEFLIVSKKSTDNGRTWGQKDTLFRVGDSGLVGLEAVLIPSLLRSGDTLHCTFLGAQSYPVLGVGVYDSEIYYSRSLNNGATWTTPVIISQNGSQYNANAGDRLLRLKNGRIIYCSSVADVNTLPENNVISCAGYKADIMYSDDNGVTWTYVDANLTTPFGSAMEPGLYQDFEGNVYCYFRTCEGFIFYSKSTNSGSTWGGIEKYGLSAGNTQSAIKYIPQLGLTIAAHSSMETKHDGTVITTGSYGYNRKKGHISVSYSAGCDFAPGFEYFTASDTAIQTFEPSIFWDNVRRELHVTHSKQPTLSDAGIWDYIITEKELTQHSAPQRDFQYLYSKYGVAIGDVDYASNVKQTPKSLFDLYLKDASNAPVLKGLQGGRIGNDNDGIVFGDAVAGAGWQNRFWFYQTTAAESRSHNFRFTHNNVSATYPALTIQFDKNGGVSDLLATDKAFSVLKPGGSDAWGMMGNGDIFCNTNFSINTIKVANINNGGSQIVVSDQLTINRPGATLRAYATTGTASASNDFGLFWNGSAWSIGNWNSTVGITANPTTEILQVIGTKVLKLPSGTTVQRPTGAAGYIRHNTTTGYFEGVRSGTTYENFLMSGSVSALMREESFTATAAQTAFTIAYTAPAVSGTNIPIRVYRNGVRLFYVASGPTSTQFTYTGNSVTTSANTAGDIITVEYLN